MEKHSQVSSLCGSDISGAINSGESTSPVILTKLLEVNADEIQSENSGVPNLNVNPTFYKYASRSTSSSHDKSKKSLLVFLIEEENSIPFWNMYRAFSTAEIVILPKGKDLTDPYLT